MVEISLLADSMKAAGLSPADLVAIGAALTAGAVAAIAAKEALRRVNLTSDERIASAEAASHEAQAVADSMARMTTAILSGSADVIKETLVAGSVLPDKV